jgi:2-keto-4-pentenoate hydratase
MSEQPAGAAIDTEALARRLDEAWENCEPIAPLSESESIEGMEQAYAIQTSWSEMRLGRGERIIGRKIGLTSFAMQEQLGVDEPDYGSLWDSRYFPAQGGRVEMPAEPFLQPFLEGELAFLIGRPLVARPGVTLQEALAATEALAMAIEVVDSRIEDWNIKLADTIADNASYGGFTMGSWSRSLREADLRTIGMLIHQDGSQVTEGMGAASLGYPARAVAWLANKLSSFGVRLEPGDIVLSGSLGNAIPVQQGNVFVLEAHGQPPLTVPFA